MPHIERTDQGDQYVLPGAERRTAPGLPYAAEADGQLTLHFYAPPDKAERRPRPVRGGVLGSGSLAGCAAAMSVQAAAQVAAQVAAQATLQADEADTGPGAAADPGPAAPQAVTERAVTESCAPGLFGRRLAHFPQVFESPTFEQT